MAVNFGEMTARILRDTYSDTSFSLQIQDAIISAIKELEQELYWLFETNVILPLSQGENSIPLPDNFVSLVNVRLIVGASLAPIVTGGTYYTDRNGFQPQSYHTLKSSEGVQATQGRPSMWALYNNNIVVSPYADNLYFLDVDYYQQDSSYPVNPIDSSLWFGDLTADLTRYRAMAIFYRDSLQSEENASIYQGKSDNAVELLTIRNNRRQINNRLSV